MRRAFVLIIFLILLSLNVHAQSVSVSIFPDEVAVKQNETAQFQISLGHDSPNSEYIEVYNPDVLWDLFLSDSPVVEPGQQKSLLVNLRPLYVNPGVYVVPLYFRLSKSSEEIRKVVTVEVQSLHYTPKEYTPSIHTGLTMDDSIDPRENASVTVVLENQNSHAGNYTIKLRSKFINADYTTWLAASEKKNVDFSVGLARTTFPQYDTLRITAFTTDTNGRLYQFDLPPKDYKILSFNDVVRTERIEKGFWKEAKVITFVNKGNVEATQIEPTPGFIARMFTSSTPALEKNGWEVRVPIDGQASITLVTNYQPVFWVLAIAIVIAAGYYVGRSPVIITKRCRVIATKEGGISELKIKLRVKNRGRSGVHHLRIIDLIPRLALLEHEDDLGGMPPLKILRHETRGTLLKWGIEVIDPGEERIITYRIRSKLSIDGLDLPPAVVKFESIAGHERTTKSERADISLISK